MREREREREKEGGKGQSNTKAHRERKRTVSSPWACEVRIENSNTTAKKEKNECYVQYYSNAKY